MYNNANAAPVHQFFEQMFSNMDNLSKQGDFPFDKQAYRKMFKNCPRRAQSNEKAAEKTTDEKTFQIRVPLKRFDPKNVKISINDKALMTISASSEYEQETGRNGMRKMTTIVEETVQLPDYLLSDMSAVIFPDVEKEMADAADNDENQASSSKNPEKLISQVKTRFEHGLLVIIVPNKPEEKKEEKDEDKKQEKKDGPVDIEIEFV